MNVGSVTYVTGLGFETPEQLVSSVFRCSGSLVHLRSIMASMNQKSSVAQTPKSVRKVLTSDTREGLQFSSSAKNVRPAS